MYVIYYNQVQIGLENVQKPEITTIISTEQVLAPFFPLSVLEKDKCKSVEWIFPALVTKVVACKSLNDTWICFAAHNDGREVDLLALNGTLPVLIRGKIKNYNLFFNAMFLYNVVALSTV